MANRPRYKERREEKKSGKTWLIVGAGCLVFVIFGGGILAAMIMPALGKAREKAREAQCKNELRMLGAEIAIARDDNANDALPENLYGNCKVSNKPFVYYYSKDEKLINDPDYIMVFCEHHQQALFGDGSVRKSSSGIESKDTRKTEIDSIP